MNVFRQAVYLLFSLCLIVLVFTVALPEGNWWYAGAQVQRLLRTQPTLQRDLITLDALAGEWDQVIGVATYLRPLTASTDFAKSINAWNSLLALLDTTHPGSGVALRLLDKLAIELVDQQSLVAQLASLDSAVSATGYFLEEPGRETLIPLRENYALQIDPMRKFHAQVADWSPALEEIDENIGGLEQALAAFEHDPNPFNQSAAALMLPVVAPLNDYVGGLSSTFSAQAELLPGQAQTMRQIVDTVVQAEEWEKQLAAPPFDLVGDTVRANLDIFFGLFLVAAGATVGLRFVR